VVLECPVPLAQRALKVAKHIVNNLRGYSSTVRHAPPSKATGPRLAWLLRQACKETSRASYVGAMHYLYPLTL
jgi:hypothetical protein